MTPLRENVGHTCNALGCACGVVDADGKLDLKKLPPLTESQTWDLRSALPPIIAYGLRVMAERGCGHPGDLTMDEWERWLREAAADFERVAENDEHVPAAGLAFLAQRWLDLWD